MEVLSRSELVAATGGVPAARWAVRSGRWVRVLHDAYVERGVELDLTCRLAALRSVLPADIAVAGRTALWLHGVLEAPGRLDLIVPRGRHLKDRPGARVRSARLDDGELCDVRGVLVVSAARALADVAREESLVEAVVVADMTLRAGATDLAHMDEAVDRAFGLRGVEQLRRARGLVEPRSESPMETRLRLTLLAGGLEGLRAQVDLYGRDGHAGRADLYVHGVAIEYDGRKERLRNDVFVDERRRQNTIADLAVQVRRFTSPDVYGRSGASLVAEVRRAQALVPTHLDRLLSGPDTLRRPRLRPWPTFAELDRRSA